jgi:hypothetical protein
MAGHRENTLLHHGRLRLDCGGAKALAATAVMRDGALSFREKPASPTTSTRSSLRLSPMVST